MDLPESRASKVCNYSGPERRERCSFADEAADVVISRLFIRFGFDLAKADDIKRIQQIIFFGETCTEFVRKGFLATAIIMAGAVAAALWAGIITFLKTES